MGADNGDQEILARIEAGLSEQDPGFAREFTAAQRLLRVRAPSWSALLDSLLRLAAAVTVFLAVMRLGQPLLLMSTTPLFLVVMRPITASMLGSPASLPSLGGWTSRRWARRWVRRGSLRSERRVLPPVHVEPVSGIDVRYAVVVGCDAQECGDGALRFAAAEAALRSTRLVLLTAFLPPAGPHPGDHGRAESVLRRRAHDAAQAALCRALGRGPDDLPPHRILTGCGEVPQLLLEDFPHAELLVIGPNQRQGMTRLLQRSSAGSQRENRGHGAVIVVPTRWTGAATDDRPDRLTDDR